MTTDEAAAFRSLMVYLGGDPSMPDHIGAREYLRLHAAAPAHARADEAAQRAGWRALCRVRSAGMATLERDGGVQ